MIAILNAWTFKDIAAHNISLRRKLHFVLVFLAENEARLGFFEKGKLLPGYFRKSAYPSKMQK
jgi:hypothetical protein